MTGSAIIDANVLLEAVLLRPNYSTALQALEQNERMVPALCLSECANALRIAALRDILSVEHAVKAMQFIQTSVTVLTDTHLYGRIVELSVMADHPAYDAVYVALAEEQKIPLLTFDRALIKTFRDLVPNVSIVDLNEDTDIT